MQSQHNEVDPKHSIFISYRQSDGTPIATRLSRLLRAAGVPVWRDADDLPPGDTEERLREALAKGLAGTILIVTPEIEKSTVVRNIELLRLLQLEPNPQFLFVVGNAVTSGTGIDYGAPDRLLGRPQGTLSRINQMPTQSNDDLRKIVRTVLMQRMDRFRELGRGGESALVVDIRTRAAPHAADFESDLPLRLHTATSGRLLTRAALEDLQLTLPLLPEAIERVQAQSIEIGGAAHLTVAFAVGCALPATFISQVGVKARDGQLWEGGNIATSGENLVHTRISGHQTWATGNTEKAVVAYVDLVPGRSDNAYGSLLSAAEGRFDEAIHVEPLSRGEIQPADAASLTAEIAGTLRALSRRNGDAEIHLALYSPFPIAVLLGRLLNTFRVVLYEWDDSAVPDGGSRSHYVPVLAVAPTNGASLINKVLLPPDSIQRPINPIRRIIQNARARIAVRRRG